MKIAKYDYEQLRAAAIDSNATQDDINALGEWFAEYGEGYWNGEYYDADEGLRLFPVYAVDEGGATVTGYEFK